MGARLTDAQTVPVMRAASFDPLEPYPGADAPWKCRCNMCEREVTTTYSRVKQGHGCRYCGKYRINSDEAAATMTLAGLHPTEPYPGGGLRRSNYLLKPSVSAI